VGSIRDRRPTADHRIGIHPQLANVDLAVYGDLAVGREVILFSITPLYGDQAIGRDIILNTSTRQGQPKKYISAQRAI
jgi:hypothetical protein